MISLGDNRKYRDAACIITECLLDHREAYGNQAWQLLMTLWKDVTTSMDKTHNKPTMPNTLDTITNLFYGITVDSRNFAREDLGWEF
jgi:hypothetical protein